MLVLFKSVFLKKASFVKYLKNVNKNSTYDFPDTSTWKILLYSRVILKGFVNLDDICQAEFALCVG